MFPDPLQQDFHQSFRQDGLRNMVHHAGSERLSAIRGQDRRRLIPT